MKQKAAAAALAAVLMVTGLGLGTCTSPLSDMLIDDPSLIRVNITVTLDVDEYGDTTSNIKAVINDKNGNNVELKEGGIRVNGVDMVVRESGGLMAYYEAMSSQLRAVPGTTYDFTITLADGAGYTALITAPNVHFYSMTAPANHPKAQDLTVSWQETDAAASMTLKAYLYCTGGLNATKTYTVTAGNTSYTIPAADLANPDCIDEIMTKIFSDRTGTIDDSFRHGSSITAAFTMAKKMQAN